jgi:hypothetical protein
MKKSYGLMLLIGTLIVAGVIAYFIFKEKKTPIEEQKQDVDDGVTPLPNEFPATTTDVSDGGFGNGDLLNETTPEPIPSNLKWVANENVARYLKDLLSSAQITKLRGWVNLIKKERANDPTRWKDSSDLTGQVSDIGHALYQMELWNQEVMFSLQDAQ